MSKLAAWVIFLLIFVLPAWGYAGQENEESPPPQSQQRPTLGPAPAPSLGGPRNSTTMDAGKLRRIRTLYVNQIDNSLSEKLVEALGKLGRFQIVSKRTQADAILSGTCFDSHRRKSVHSEVFIADRNGAAIWQDVVYRPFNPPALAKAVDETALLVVAHLGQSIREAEHN